MQSRLIIDCNQVERDLRRLAITVRDSNDAITLHDCEGNIVVWNPAAERRGLERG